jgi:hypothetical protein
MIDSDVSQPATLLRPAAGTIGWLRTPLRWTGVLALLASAVTHVPVTPEHLQEVPYVGALFVALMVACLALAVALAARDSPVVWAATAAVTAPAIAAYAVSRSVGLPGMADDIGNWGEPLGIAAITVEGIALVTAAAALTPPTRRRFRTGAARRCPSSRSACPRSSMG